MRQGQQNRRGRGRNRKSQNPLTRSFESNGPDIKIRGTPSHIAEKYISLARDALASGDPVLAENYLQHAEHYNRIIMTYREQQTAHGEGVNGSGNGRSRPSETATDQQDEDLSESEDVVPGQEPQPVIAQDAKAGDGQDERPERGQRRGGGRGLPRRRRQDAASNGDGDNQGEGDAPRNSRRREAFTGEDEQPEFLKRPVRRSRRAAASNEEDDGASEGASADEAAE